MSYHIQPIATKQGITKADWLAYVPAHLHDLAARKRRRRDVGTGLRMSELFALQWHDIDFQKNEISVTRSIVFQVVGPCKTEASQKPVPLDCRLAEALKVWRDHAIYREAEDWGFASPASRGRRPYWGQWA